MITVLNKPDVDPRDDNMPLMPVVLYPRPQPRWLTLLVTTTRLRLIPHDDAHFFGISFPRRPFRVAFDRSQALHCNPLFALLVWCHVREVSDLGFFLQRECFGLPQTFCWISLETEINF